MGFFTSILPRWATGAGAAITEPNEAKKDAGWIVEAPPHDYFNWLARRTYDCLQEVDGAVSAPTASKLVVRDANGRAQVVDPSVAADIATKKYVDDYGWHRAVASADTSCSSDTVPVDIAGLSFAAESGKKYLVRAHLFVYAAATSTGLGISAKATGAPPVSTKFFNHSHWIDPGSAPALSLTAYENFTDSPGPSATTMAALSTYPQSDGFEGYFVTTGAGTYQLRLVSEINTSAVTVKAGSYLEWCVAP